VFPFFLSLIGVGILKVSAIILGYLSYRDLKISGCALVSDATETKLTKQNKINDF